MRVALIVVFKRDSQTRERCWCVRLVHIGDVIVLHGLHERFRHAIALRRTDRCGQRLKTQFASEAARAVVDVGRAVVRQLTNFLRDAVEPRVTTNLLSHAVPLAAGGHVVVLRVAPSPNAPHRLLRNNHFYLRNSVGKETMDIHAIRTAFAFSEGLADRAVAFRDRRLGMLRSRQIQVPLVPDQPMLVVHLVPVLSLTRREGHTIEELKAAAEDLQRAQPAANPLGRPVANFEGVICTSNTDRQDQHYAFAQLFRDGCIELVSVLTTEEQGNPPLPTIFPATYEPSLVQHALPVAFQALTTLGIPAPLYLSVSLLNVRGMRVAIRRPRTGLAGFPELPANLVDLTSSLRYVEDPAVSPAVLAGPAIDVVWNAVGIDHSQIVIWNPAP